MKIAVIGLGLEGRDVINYILDKNTEITVLDRKSMDELDTTGLDTKKVKFVTGDKYLENLERYDVIFRSPGVYRYLPELIEAEKAGVKISSATLLFFEQCPGKIIGVTGTKGKGTTSTLIYEILKAADKDIYLVGNIGKPSLELLPQLTSKSYVVMEMSSFQLIDMTKSPQVAVVLNVTVDHLDWHKSREEYVAAKQNIVLHQKPTELAVINFDYPTSKNFDKLTKGQVVYFSRFNKPGIGTHVTDGQIVIANKNKKIVLGETQKLLLRGEHNWENVNAAVSATYFSGIDIEVIIKTVFSFKGLEHRLELVTTKKRITFYNDSFSTNPQPTMAAVDSFSEPITLILGGSDKGLNYDELGQYLTKKRNVKNIVLIGQIAPMIKSSLEKAKFTGKIIDLGMTTMKDIVQTCVKETEKGGVVLLSPATASFGMFTDYKDRGYQFKECVLNLRN